MHPDINLAERPGGEFAAARTVWKIKKYIPGVKSLQEIFHGGRIEIFDHSQRRDHIYLREPAGRVDKIFNQEIGLRSKIRIDRVFLCKGDSLWRNIDAGDLGGTCPDQLKGKSTGGPARIHDVHST